MSAVVFHVLIVIGLMAAGALWGLLCVTALDGPREVVRVLRGRRW